MVTGQNTGLSAALLMEQYRRNRLAIAAQHTWVEAGYCIDAPVLIAAGSHERDVFGDGDEDWLPMPTSALREPSNVELTGLRRSYGEGPVERRVGGNAAPPAPTFERTKK